MNRELEFRGRLKSDGTWVYGDLIHDNCCASYIFPIESRCLSLENEVYPDTIGQFTGLTDKNGKRIFEGDIVECVIWNEYFSKDGKPMEPFRRKMFVDYRKGGFKMVEPMPEPMKDNEWDIICNGDIVIIGNIHDNPDLLSSTKA